MNNMSEKIEFIDLTSMLEEGTVLAERQHVSTPRELAAHIKNLPLGANQVLVLAALETGAAEQLAQLTRLMIQNKLQTERLVSAMFTRNTVSPAAAQQAQRNAEARQELIDEFDLYDSEQVANIAGSSAKNRSATASRWLADGRIFAVEHFGARLYPGFQFGTDGHPRPVIQRVLQAFEPYGLDGWETALWFTTASGWLDDKRPVDLLTTAPDDVVEAAGHAFGEVAA